MHRILGFGRDKKIIEMDERHDQVNIFEEI